MEGVEFYASVREVRDTALKWIRYYTVEGGLMHPVGREPLVATREHVSKLMEDLAWSSTVLAEAGMN